jgi:hypothetical protein
MNAVMKFHCPMIYRLALTETQSRFAVKMTASVVLVLKYGRCAARARAPLTLELTLVEMRRRMSANSMQSGILFSKLGKRRWKHV